MNATANPLRYASICSGIEATTVAWEPLGLIPSWFAEIAAFPSAVLTHHYPHVPNLGDMTRIADQIMNGAVSAPDILVGGTPCQSFSVAGLRQGLSDPRGALTLKYTEIANAIDQIRTTQRQAPTVIVWENVPGILADRANAFGCFLSAISGERRELQPPGHKWTDAGCVMDPKGQSRGGFLMPNISAWPNVANVCSLLQVLETTSIPPKYFLSPRACAGILRRASNQSKTLPTLLHQTLATQAGGLAPKTHRKRAKRP